MSIALIIGGTALFLTIGEKTMLDIARDTTLDPNILKYRQGWAYVIALGWLLAAWLVAILWLRDGEGLKVSMGVSYILGKDSKAVDSLLVVLQVVYPLAIELWLK
jgi:hypothetical protein